MVNQDRIKKDFAEMVAIDSPSLKERKLGEHLKKLFGEIGIALEEDDSGVRTGSDTGNLYAYVKGGGLEPPILLSAHMDTVEPAVGKKAVFHEDGKITSDGTTVLGADDFAGITVIYEALRYVKENKLKHRDVELLFTTGEELFCVGAKEFDFTRIQSRQAYVLDLSGSAGRVATAAPTILSFHVTVEGVASHAGFHPEGGINAIAVAAKAVSSLAQGRIDGETTANIGKITGGDGINIVSSRCVLEGEIRGRSHEKVLETRDLYRKTFEKLASQSGAKIIWEDRVHIESYEIPQDSRVIKDFVAAAAGAEVPVEQIKTFGGSDNNVFVKHGIPGIVVANAMNRVHSREEYTDVSELSKAIDIVIHLLRGVGS